MKVIDWLDAPEPNRAVGAKNFKSISKSFEAAEWFSPWDPISTKSPEDFDGHHIVH